MKNIAIVFVAILILTGCSKSEDKTAGSSDVKQNNDGVTKVTEGDTPQSEVLEINVPTIQCGTCKKNIEKALKKIDGVNEAKVNVKEKKAVVKFDKSKTDQNAIEGAIVMAGYQANDKPANQEAYDKLEDCCKIGGHD